jgi:hypothetical protein
MTYINNEYGVYLENICKRCGATPAVSYTADCCGDAVEAMCLDCWKKFVLEVVAEAFSHELDFVEIEPTKKTNSLPSNRRLYTSDNIHEINAYRTNVLKVEPLRKKES